MGSTDGGTNSVAETRLAFYYGLEGKEGCPHVSVPPSLRIKRSMTAVKNFASKRGAESDTDSWISGQRYVLAKDMPE